MEIWLEIIQSVSPLVVAVLSVYLSNRLVVYRVDQLEKKMDRHNETVEKVIKLQASDEAQWKWIDKFKEKMQ